MMGDINAKIGGDNRGSEEVMGKEAMGVMNENGEMFADFCADNNLVIGAAYSKQIIKLLGYFQITEIPKAGETVAVNMMHHFINKIRNEEIIPSEWNKGVIIKLPQKGNKTKCEN
ncbi:hypothetical protein CBL_05223 [Carabus blaptoides fortunei]